MAKFWLIGHSTERLTRELAERFRTMPSSPTERLLNEGRLDDLTHKAAAGLLVTFHWGTAKLGEQLYRVNGLTSSTMLCGLNGSFPEDLVAHIDEYEVDSAEGLALLFRQFDPRTSARKPIDVYMAYQGIVEELRCIRPPVGRLGIEGIAWYFNSVEHTPTPRGDDMFSMVMDSRHHDFLLWLNTLLDLKCKEVQEKPIVAAMYATFEQREEQAREFWRYVVRGGVDFEESHPTTVLDRWLKDAKEKVLKKKPAPGEYYTGCIYAWRAAQEQRTIRSIQSEARRELHELLP
jgi:hypothetical protein